MQRTLAARTVIKRRPIVFDHKPLIRHENEKKRVGVIHAAHAFLLSASTRHYITPRRQPHDHQLHGVKMHQLNFGCDFNAGIVHWTTKMNSFSSLAHTHMYSESALSLSLLARTVVRCYAFVSRSQLCSSWLCIHRAHIESVCGYVLYIVESWNNNDARCHCVAMNAIAHRK